MPDNQHIYGYRFHRTLDGRDMPTPVERLVANAYQATNDGAGFNVGLSIGDPVKLVSDGSVALAKTTESIFGIIVGFKPYWNGSRMEPTSYLPGGTAPGTTVRDRFSRVLVVPVSNNQLWEIDCNDKTTATTEAAYEAFVGENCTVVVPGNQTNSSRPTADPMLDISEHAVTESLVVRIEGVSPTMANQYFDGLYVKMLVRFNESQNPGQAATNNVGV